MSTVAITGVTGFVGRALAPALEARGWTVRGVVRAAPRPGQVAIGELARPVDWAPVVDGADVIVHLAGIAHTHGVADEAYDEVNHRRTAELARAARGAGVSRLVFVSSIKAQSGATSRGLLDEHSPATPDDAYGRSKLAAERAIADSGVGFAILRPVLIYGPGVKGNLASLDRLARLPVPLPFGAMHNRRSLCALAGLIDAIELVATDARAAGEVAIAADREPIELRDLIAAIRAARGRRPWLVPVPPAMFRIPLHALGRDGMWERLGGEQLVSSAKLRALGWHARDTATELARTRLS